ncbi:hypothetical protein GGR54DRAFT_640495 [Hypoxylon sp. NC1633]|nr:hypothetical protein GGR54DRAFT_640495 [Hypoxylon sp. NC1633]
MEVLGAVAASGQLIGTVIKILDSIAQLRDFLKHAPARCRGWRTQLSVLGDTISSIRDNSALQTHQIGRIIEDMAPKIESLMELCVRYTPEPRLKLFKKLTRALSARAIEAQILYRFQALEHDKTSLILTISAMNGSGSHRQSHRAREVEDKDDKEDKEDEAQNQDASGPTRLSTSNLAQQEVDDLTSNINDNSLLCLGQNQLSQQISNMDGSKNNMPPEYAQQILAMFAALQQSAGGQPNNSFTHVTLRGDGSLCGSTAGAAKIDDVNVQGDANLSGTHSPEVALAFIQTLLQRNSSTVPMPTEQSPDDGAPAPVNGARQPKMPIATNQPPRDAKASAPMNRAQQPSESGGGAGYGVSKSGAGLQNEFDDNTDD